MPDLPPTPSFTDRPDPDGDDWLAPEQAEPDPFGKRVIRVLVIAAACAAVGLVAAVLTIIRVRTPDTSIQAISIVCAVFSLIGFIVGLVFGILVDFGVHGKLLAGGPENGFRRFNSRKDPPGNAK